jgi:GNAT superfamily N-acetyltransferase
LGEVVIELLSRTHDRESFDCGRINQDEFLKKRARKHAELNYSKTWVAVDEGDARILGFITISMASIEFEKLGDVIRQRLPRYPMPVLHVGQLATDLKYQGRGVRSLLLAFAASKAIEASARLGCYGIDLIADSQEAFDYYLRRGFTPLSPGSMRLYVPIETLSRAVSFAREPDLGS